MAGALSDKIVNDLLLQIPDGCRDEAELCPYLTAPVYRGSVHAARRKEAGDATYDDELGKLAALIGSYTLDCSKGLTIESNGCFSSNFKCGSQRVAPTLIIN